MRIKPDLVLPRSALPYALFQRVHFLPRAGWIIRLLFDGFSQAARFKPLHQQIRRAQAMFFVRAIRREYSEDIVHEFKTLESHLPISAHTIMDIGAGIAGIDALISRRYDHAVDIVILDKTRIEKRIFYSYFDQAAFYSSLAIGADVLVANGVSQDRITTIEAPDSGIGYDGAIDVVISLTAWGYHFPVETYMDAVYDRLTSGGILIMDIRRGTDGQDVLKKKFGNCMPILVSDEHAYARVLARKE